MAERFRAIGINTVKICNYDLSLHPKPAAIKEDAQPMAVFIKAYQKHPPFIFYTDSPKVKLVNIKP